MVSFRFFPNISEAKEPRGASNIVLWIHFIFYEDYCMNGMLLNFDATIEKPETEAPNIVFEFVNI